MTTHGLSSTRLYRIWHGIEQRCNNPNNKAYKSYGGRGIRVCELWLRDFKSFYDWAISNGYKDFLTLDRLNNNGNYEPSNCRWATQKVQLNNTRVTTFIEINGEFKSISEWSLISGISKSGLRNRLIRGVKGKELLKPSMKGRVKTESWRNKLGTPITIDGVTYHNRKAAATALGISYSAFKGRLKRGTLFKAQSQGFA